MVDVCYSKGAGGGAGGGADALPHKTPPGTVASHLQGTATEEHTECALLL